MLVLSKHTHATMTALHAYTVQVHYFSLSVFKSQSNSPTFDIYIDIDTDRCKRYKFYFLLPTLKKNKTGRTFLIVF